MAGAGRHAVAPRRSRRWLACAVVIAFAAAAGAVVTAVTVPGYAIDGHPRAAATISVLGKPDAVRRIPPNDPLPHESTGSGEIAAVVADLDRYWATTLPGLNGTRFTSLAGGLDAVDSAATGGTAPCLGSLADASGNAFYCPQADGIVYDAATLVPVVLAQYGPPGLVGTFAHEFAHAVQDRIGPTDAQRRADPGSYPSLLIELQADCDAGAFLAWVDAGHAPHIRLGSGQLLEAIGPLIDFSDAATTEANDPTAHGLAIDRLTAVADGFRHGAAACRAMTAGSLDAVVGTVDPPAGGRAAMATPRYPSTQAVIDAAQASLADFTGTAAAVRPDAAALDTAAPYGQFAQAAAVAFAVGTDRTGSRAAAACFVGAWTASIYGHAPAGSLGAWPGDADEALAALRHGSGADFAELAGYADGFHHGLGACG